MSKPRKYRDDDSSYHNDFSYSDFSDDGKEDRAYYERRRRAKKARRARERRRRRRQNLIVVTVGMACVLVIVIVLLAQAGIFPGGAGTRNAAAVSGSTEESAEGASSAASGDAAESVGGASTDSQAEIADTAGSDSTEEMAESNGIFKRTADTIDLGKSLTDISIYDAQRHIIRNADGTTEIGEGSSVSTAADTSSGTASEAASNGDSSENAGTLSSESGTASDTESAAAGSSDDPALAPDYIDSQYAILVNADTGEIVAERDGEAKIVPASMTKVLTLLTAVDAMSDPEKQLNDTFEITQDIADEVYKTGSSIVGYGVGDQAKVEDLLYGTILPSGADAAMALADYTAGSQEKFAQMMNEKAAELGISDTSHFTNCIGLYNEDHYSTPYDMAVIMKAAYDNDLCRKVLSTHTWTTAATRDHPEGIEISNWFLRKIEDHMSTGDVECAKTGFVNESGNCAVSAFTCSTSGTHYIACTALTYNSWRCIFDHANLYTTYAK